MDSHGTTLATNKPVTFTPMAGGGYNAASIYQSEISVSSVADQLRVDRFNHDWNGGLSRP